MEWADNSRMNFLIKISILLLINVAFSADGVRSELDSNEDLWATLSGT